jgi:hypothetical protein
MPYGHNAKTERNEEIVAMRRAGKSYKVIGERFNIAPVTVLGIARRAGIKPFVAKSFRLRKFGRLLRDGADVDVLVAKTGYHRSYVIQLAQEAGVILQKTGQNWTEEELLGALHKHCDEAGQIPGFKDFVAAAKGRPCAGTYVRRFGSWNEALNKAFGLRRLKNEQ